MNNQPGAEAVVRAFFASWEQDGFEPAFKRFLAPQALWQNTGFPDARGLDAILKLLQQYHEFSRMPYARVELLHVAADGNSVLTERIDHLYNADRSRQHSARIMGVLEVANGQITRYADYFDPAQFQAMMADAAGRR